MDGHPTFVIRSGDTGIRFCQGFYYFNMTVGCCSVKWSVSWTLNRCNIRTCFDQLINDVNVPAASSPMQWSRPIGTTGRSISTGTYECLHNIYMTTPRSSVQWHLSLTLAD